MSAQGMDFVNMRGEQVKNLIDQFKYHNNGTSRKRRIAVSFIKDYYAGTYPDIMVCFIECGIDLENKHITINYT
jgi:hypothetical protein